MSKQKNNEVLKYNEPAFVGAGDYLIPLIRLQPVEEKKLGNTDECEERFCRSIILYVLMIWY